MSNNSLTKIKIKKIKASANRTISKNSSINNPNSNQNSIQNLQENNLNKDLQNSKQCSVQNVITIQTKLPNAKQNENPDFFSNLQKEYQTVQEIITKFADFPRVTFYGGANVKNDSKDYLEIQKLANSLSKLGFVVASGGGPGIMAAAISGANGEFDCNEFENSNQKNCQKNKTESQNEKYQNLKKITNKQAQIKISTLAPTLGLRMNLVSEPPPFLGTFDYLFTDFAPRKLALRSSEILIFAPGGFGTLDELMEILTLLKTRKMFNKQVFLYNSNFWKNLLSWICREIMGNHLAAEEFLQYFVVCDQVSDILEMIKNPDIYRTKCEQNSCFLR